MRIGIKEIKVNPRHRKTEPNHIRELADSITGIGLLNPITVDKHFVLIAGLHRLEAVKSLGWEEIECCICDLEGLQAEMAEIDENYIRLDLGPTEQGEMLLRRKEIYEALHPETKYSISQGMGMRRKADGDLVANLATRSKTFVEDTSEKLGIAPRTIRRQVQIAKNLTPEAKEVLKFLRNIINLTGRNCNTVLTDKSRRKHGQVRREYRLLRHRHAAPRDAP